MSDHTDWRSSLDVMTADQLRALAIRQNEVIRRLENGTTHLPIALRLIKVGFREDAALTIAARVDVAEPADSGSVILMLGHGVTIDVVRPAGRGRE